MVVNSIGYGIYDGFEGYNDPSEAEVLGLLETCPVVLDTNVLLDIYGFEEPARILALDVLGSVESRLWVPHQVMREFWRNRHSTIARIPTPAEPIGALRNELFAIFNSLRPDRERTEEIQTIRETVEKQLDELETAISEARGNALDLSKILNDTSLDPVLTRLEQILDGRVGQSFGDEEPEVIEEGLKRFAASIPPGYKDGIDKEDQIPERGTGDYLMWEQTLRYIEAVQPKTRAFVLVTNDAKEDWRIAISKPKRRVLGVRPELVSEALQRTGSRLVLLQQNDFYRLMSKMRPGDEAASESLVQASTLSAVSSQDSEPHWSIKTYRRLLNELREVGNQLQADIISLAAGGDGFIAREKIYLYAGYDEDRSLRRFALPAQRIALDLVESGMLSEDAPKPLEAVYEGPGKTIGYRVPNEFIKFEAQSHKQPTWLQAAARAATIAPEHVWTVDELVSEIASQGLRDVSSIQAPEITLQRDLSRQDNSYFEEVEGGFKPLDRSMNSIK